MALPKLLPFWRLVEEIHTKSIFKGGLTSVILNFGTWESAIGNEEILSECHAHAHLHFHPQTMTLLPQTAGKIQTCPHYAKKDGWIVWKGH
jgi:hypothetical protein